MLSKQNTRIYDVSMPLKPGMISFPGDPLFEEKFHKSIDNGNSANVSMYTIGSHSGTHVDFPNHFFRDGKTLQDVPVERFLGKVKVIDVPEDVKIITSDHIKKHEPLGVKNVFFKTRNSSPDFVYGKKFRTDFTSLGYDAATHLVKRGILLVGIDYLSIEEYGNKMHAVHTTLLKNEIVIVEGLVLKDVEPGIYNMICLPLNLPDANGGPARVILLK